MLVRLATRRADTTSIVRRTRGSGVESMTHLQSMGRLDAGTRRLGRRGSERYARDSGRSTSKGHHPGDGQLAHGWRARRAMEAVEASYAAWVFSSSTSL